MIQYPGYPPMPNPAGLFPTFNPGPSTIDTVYKNGGITTRTQAPGAPESSGPYQQLAAMMAQPVSQPAPGGKGKRSHDTRGTIQAMHQPIPGHASGQVTAPTWYQQQGAATRPIGLGAQMLPGMAVDPRLLPPSMRPKENQLKPSDRIENAAYKQATGASGPAGLGGAQQQAEALGGGSNSGFDYLPPAEQQRWLAALARSNGAEGQKS